MSKSAACIKRWAPTALRKAESDERPFCTVNRSGSATDDSCSGSAAAANGQAIIGSSVAIAQDLKSEDQMWNGQHVRQPPSRQGKTS
ncbi:MAG TPA: hypothetical protein VGB07_06280, partial [Blastocatellia bacterium]